MTDGLKDADEDRRERGQVTWDLLMRTMSLGGNAGC